MDQATCSGCAAPIRWVITGAGNRMPIDAEPVPDGNVIFVRDELAVALFGDPGETQPSAEVVRVLGNGQPAPGGIPTYKSHFATCPAADEFRRRP